MARQPWRCASRSATIGALLTPALAWLGWEMAPGLAASRRRLALWAGLAVLGLLWSQVFARYAVRVELFALVETLGFAALWRAWRKDQGRWWALAGALIGLGFYTYLPVRLLPLVFAPAAALALWRQRPQLFTRRRGLILMIAAALLVALPLSLYFIRNPLSFSTRVGQVGVLDKGPAALGNNLRAVLGMALVAGDPNPRANLPGRPALDWLLAIPFLVGLGYLVWRWRRPAALFTLTWLGVMLLPTVLSDYAPSFQRAIGALPAFALIVALGLDRLVAWATARWRRGQGGFEAAGWVILAASLVVTWRALRRLERRAGPLLRARCGFHATRPKSDR